MYLLWIRDKSREEWILDIYVISSSKLWFVILLNRRKKKIKFKYILFDYNFQFYIIIINITSIINILIKEDCLTDNLPSIGYLFFSSGHNRHLVWFSLRNKDILRGESKMRIFLVLYFTFSGAFTTTLKVDLALLILSTLDSILHRGLHRFRITDSDHFSLRGALLRR